MKRFPYFFAISDELNIQLALSNSNLKGKKSFELKREVRFSRERNFVRIKEKVRFSRGKNFVRIKESSILKGKKSFELKRELHYIFIWKGNYYFIFTVTLNMFKL